jgi:glycosyltransferase involved in cell wall biosynthesis
LKKLSILIPAFNEENTITSILEVLKDLSLNFSLQKEIIVVNDHSTDNTKDLIEKFQHANPEISLTLHNQKSNQGKGAALHKAIEIATGDFIIWNMIQMNIIFYLNQ